MSRPKSGTWVANSKIIGKPHERHDGELYDRPIPNPFTPEWADGYDDGQQGLPRSTDGLTKGQMINYLDGYDIGEHEKEAMDRDSSTNT